MVGAAPISAPLREDPELDSYADPILDAVIGQLAMHGLEPISIDDVAPAARAGQRVCSLTRKFIEPVLLATQA